MTSVNHNMLFQKMTESNVSNLAKQNDSSNCVLQGLYSTHKVRFPHFNFEVLSFRLSNFTHLM